MKNQKMYYRGFYKVKNPHKYRGDPNNVVYRSSWELNVLKWLDNNPSVLWFASEELPIPYVSPVDNKVHRYFPDFIVRIKRKDGQEQTSILEVKPYKQTLMPSNRRKTKQYLFEVAQYAVNQAKWKAADLFCKEHGWQFQLITEKELGI
jgi:hypothetical protein